MSDTTTPDTTTPDTTVDTGTLTEEKSWQDKLDDNTDTQDKQDVSQSTDDDFLDQLFSILNEEEKTDTPDDNQEGKTPEVNFEAENITLKERVSALETAIDSDPFIKKVIEAALSGKTINISDALKKFVEKQTKTLPVTETVGSAWTWVKKESFAEMLRRAG